MRRAGLLLVALSLGALVTTAACGKGDAPHGPDLRTPPAIPSARGSAGTAPATTERPATAPGAHAPAPVAPAAPAAPPAAPALPVKVAPPVERTIAVTVDYTGQTIGSETVEVRARVEGYLQSIHFTEGTFVQAGDLLYEIDKDKATETVEQAVGELNIAKANLGKAQTDVARYAPLLEKNAISREEYDTAVAAEKAASASVDAATAKVNRARIQLGYATVRAPMAGLVGKTEVDVGNLVGRGQATLLTTISKVDPIYVNVRLSESDLLEYQRKRKESGQPGAQDIALFLSDKSEHPHRGKVAVVDRNVDAATGTLLIKISFPNPDQTVRPGQFARIQGVRERIENALLVPQGAVEELQGTYRLYLVGDGDLVEVRTVKVGSRQGPLWVIAEGLKPGDRVIVEGRQKVKAGMRVAPQVVELLDPSAPPEKPAGEGAKSPAEGTR